MRTAVSQDFRLSPNGLVARLVLAFLTSAGIMYANVSPVIVSGMIQAGLDNEQAGFVFSANMYGSAIGAFLIIGLIKKLRWRETSYVLISLLVVIDLLTAWISEPSLIYGLRAVHGLIGGASVGLGFSVIARTSNPERTFAFLIVVQSGLAGFGTALLTPLLDTVGVRIVWLSLVTFSLLVVLLVPFLDDYPPKDTVQGGQVGSMNVPLLTAGLALAAIFLYQAGEMAAFSFMIEIGNHRAFSTSLISGGIALSQWLSVPAAFFVVWWSTRTGRVRPVVLGILATLFSVGLLLLPGGTAFFMANVLFGICFALTLPYLLGLASELEPTGQMAALGGFASKMGLATGPAVAGLIIGDDQFDRVILLSISLLGLSILAVIYPARSLDGRTQQARKYVSKKLADSDPALSDAM